MSAEPARSASRAFSLDRPGSSESMPGRANRNIFLVPNHAQRYACALGRGLVQGVAMKCPKCGHENTAEAKFCEQCAAPLGRACGNCGSRVSSTAKFCAECGHPLKRVADDLRFASPKHCTPQHLAYKILTSMTIRVGLNSGDIVVRAIGNDLHMDYTVVGQTVHLASRMEQMAKPGCVLITRNTLQLAEGYVSIRSLGPVPVKGLTEPLQIFEVTGAGAARTGLQAALGRGLTRFIGRGIELEELRRAQQLAGGGRGQVVAIVGEAGVGKSRLVHEFVH